MDDTTATRRAAFDASLLDPRSNRAKVVALLRRYPSGLTCDQIEELDGMQFSTAGAVILELRNDGWVRQSSDRPTRKTRRGRSAAVWVLAREQIPAGFRQLAAHSKRNGEGVAQVDPVHAAAHEIVDAMDAKDKERFRAALATLRDALKGA